MEDLEERAKHAGIEIAVRTNFLMDPANAVRNLKVRVHRARVAAAGRRPADAEFVRRIVFALSETGLRGHRDYIIASAEKRSPPPPSVPAN